MIIIDVPEYPTLTNSNADSGPTDKLKKGPSTSLTSKFNSKDSSSLITWFSIGPKTIGSLTGVTVRIKSIVSVNKPSDTEAVTTISPLKSK